MNICEKCGKEYYVKPSHRKKRKHCSVKCLHEKTGEFKIVSNGKRLTKRYLTKIICVTCGKEFYSSKKRSRFCGKKCFRWIRKKTGSRGEVKTSHGYKIVKNWDHPHHNRHGYVFVHRIIAEKTIGRHLFPWEVVHHIDRNKSNNKPENLQVMSEYDHAVLHNKDRWAGRKFMAVDAKHCRHVKEKEWEEKGYFQGQA